MLSIVALESDIYTHLLNLLNSNFGPVLIKTNSITLANAEQQQRSATACVM